MPYSTSVLDHLHHPRNAGSLDRSDPNVGTGSAGAAETGSTLRLQIRVNPATGRIEAARFKAFGCGYTIASGSLLTEWLLGRTPEQASRIESAEIIRELALPPDRVHCATQAEDALQAALHDWRQKQAGNRI